MCMSLLPALVYVHVLPACLVPITAKKVVEYPGTRVKNDCKLLCGFI